MHEAIELFGCCGFNLVKWSQNRETIFVLANLDKKVLISGMHDLNLSKDYGVDLLFARTLGCVWRREKLFANCEFVNIFKEIHLSSVLID